MNIKLDKSTIDKKPSTIIISGSKSETNRLLLLQALYSNIQIENASNSDDSEVMIKALQQPTTTNPPTTIDVHHAGTAMRFLTAFFAIQENKEVVITGSSRMKERPIKVLVDALQELGAEIYYKEKNGYPPLHIIGKKITKNKISIPANVSSQYISALLLVAPKLENGLEITLQGKITSLPYINMTLALLKEIGVTTSFKENKIQINPLISIPPSGFRGLIESDWSSASYWYSIIALSEIGTAITLSHFKKNSLQGDAVLPKIYNNFGVKTVFENNKITLQKVENHQLSTINFELNNSPDIAQTIAVTCFGLGITCDLFGLHTLKIKETNRLLALKTELEKLGAKVVITNDSLHIQSSKINIKNCVINSYQDHRMALAFAPLAIKFPLIIQDAQVVSKSYPTFWNDLKTVGFKIQEK